MAIICAMIISSLLALKFNKKTEYFVAACLIVFVFVVHICDIVGNPMWGVYFIVAASIVSVMILISMAVRGFSGNIKELFFSSGMLAFYIYAFVFAMICVGRSAMETGDPNYWIIPIKKFYYSNSINMSYAEESSYSGVGAIHPFFSLVYGYLIEKTWIHWSDGVLVWGRNMFLVSMLLPLFSFVDLKDRKSLINKFFHPFIFIIVYLLPYLSMQKEYAHFLIDIVFSVSIAMAIVFLMEFIQTNSLLPYINSMLFLSAAVLMKRIGIVIVILLTVWVVPIICMKKNKAYGAVYVIFIALSYVFLWKVDKYVLGMMLPLISAMCFCFVYKNREAIEKRVVSKLPIIFFCVGIILFASIFAIRDYWISYDGFTQDVLRVYWRAFFLTDKMAIGGLSLATFILINTLLFILALRFDVSAKQFRGVFFGILFSSLVFIALLAYIYVTGTAVHTYNKYGIYIQSFERYTLFIPVLLVLFWIYYVVALHSDGIFLPTALVIMLLICNLPNAISDLTVKPKRKQFNGFSEANIELSSSDVIGYIDMAEDDGYFQFWLYITPANIEYIYELAYYHRNEEGTDISKDDLEKRLSKCSYVYVQNVDEMFSTKYGDLFEGDIEDGGVVYYYDEIEGKLKRIK